MIKETSTDGEELVKVRLMKKLLYLNEYNEILYSLESSIWSIWQVLKILADLAQRVVVPKKPAALIKYVISKNISYANIFMSFIVAFGAWSRNQ
jgi:hypothetical protein